LIKIDYAIVGGGVAGTYCAWRLKQAYPEKKIILFEYSKRIGGRLLSLSPKEWSNIGKVTKSGGLNVVAELGGMRYLPQQHKIFEKVREMLNLETVDFPMGSMEDPNGELNIAYFRRTWLRIKELGRLHEDPDRSRDPFPKLSWSEKGKDPDELHRHIMKTFVPNLKDIKTYQQWGEVDLFGKKLYQFGFWNLLYRVLTPEAYTFLKYGSGYDTNVSNGSAAVLLPTADEFSPGGTKFKTLKDGLQSLPLKMAEEFEKKYHGKICMNHHLHSIEQSQEDKKSYFLKFFKTITTADENGRSETIDVDPTDEQYVATNVILAMPRAALEYITWDQLEKDEFLRKNLGSVLNQPAMKILLVYDYAWWKSIGIVHGRSITDLPIRQTLYFTSPEEAADLKGISKKPALLLASYNDIETIPFWKGLIGGDSFDGPDGYRASKAMVKEAHEQVEEMHDFEEMPKPIAAAFCDWSQYPYGAGWHCWKANFKFWEIAEQMCKPIKTENVYICGDAYSLSQGWAEGALETAEHVLTKDLDEPLVSIIEKEEKDFEYDKRIKRRR